MNIISKLKHLYFYYNYKGLAKTWYWNLFFQAGSDNIHLTSYYYLGLIEYFSSWFIKPLLIFITFFFGFDILGVILMLTYFGFDAEEDYSDIFDTTSEAFTEGLQDDKIEAFGRNVFTKNDERLHPRERRTIGWTYFEVDCAEFIDVVDNYYILEENARRRWVADYKLLTTYKKLLYSTKLNINKWSLKKGELVNFFSSLKSRNLIIFLRTLNTNSRFYSPLPEFDAIFIYWLKVVTLNFLSNFCYFTIENLEQQIIELNVSRQFRSSSVRFRSNYFNNFSDVALCSEYYLQDDFYFSLYTYYEQKIYNKVFDKFYYSSRFIKLNRNYYIHRYNFYRLEQFVKNYFGLLNKQRTLLSNFLRLKTIIIY